MESGKMEVRLSEFKIGALVSAQCDMARPLAEKKNIDLDFTASPNLPPVPEHLRAHAISSAVGLNTWFTIGT